MDVLGYTESGMIRVIFDGEGESFVPDDVGNRHRQMIAAWEAEGNEVPPYTPPAPTIHDYETAIQAVVDATAKEKLFRDGVTLASYTASTNPQWAAEALAFVAWRDGVWAYAYSELAKVQSGQRQQPTVEEFLAEVEPIEWPSSAPA
ncbi:hypothetical protein [Shinella sumterensis]|uniref:Uncharacterized protein n=1 Tax=Shinella sumterensis TaxID=1967501 RepID=A0AA50CP80_9HYPH|nr:hypothetical protein [Shinella sumterensis]WLR98758.1 hypothetical protein Q9313_06975 [Shinella sumterensis]